MVDTERLAQIDRTVHNPPRPDEPNGPMAQRIFVRLMLILEDTDR
jgi:hypothetical protein